MLDRRRLLLLGAGAGGALLGACGTDERSAATGASSSGRSSSSGAPSPSGSTSAPAGPAASPLATPDYPTGVLPARLLIPSIDVDAPVVELQLGRDEVEVPEDFATAGWWVQTRRPGEIGPSVLGGHVDSTTGPAVFFRLPEVVPGAEVVVVGDDGTQVVFVVDEGVQVDKVARPPEVFAFGQPRPELRLITCTGEFDPAARSYTDNYVLLAHQEGVGL